MNSKKCVVCSIEKALTAENFHRTKQSKSGFRSICKECRKKEETKEARSTRKRKWYEENKEKAKDYRRNYYLEHQQENNNEKCKIYRDKNKEKFRIISSEKYHKNKEKISSQRKILYKKTAVQKRERQRLWRTNNPERSKEIDITKHHKRKALMKKVQHDYNHLHWNECKKHFENQCAYCGELQPLAQEHFVPVSKGGEYTRNNILPSCKSCNSRKNNKNFFDWYKNDDSYCPIREKKILDYLNYKNNIQQLSIL